jgi:macrolide-specific efflux system membrane fusion protein
VRPYSPGVRRFLRRRYLLALGGVIVVAFAGSMAYVRAAGQSPSYRTALVGYGTVTQTLSMSGNLAPASESNLNFAVAGTVTEVDVQAGQQVAAGEVLAKLDPTSLQASLTDAQANLSSAEARLSLDEGGPMAQSLASATSQVSSAQVNLSNAETAEADTEAINQQSVQSGQQQVTDDQSVVTSDQNVLQADQSQQQSDCSTYGSSSPQCTQDNQKVAQDQQTLSKDQSALDSAQSNLQSTELHAKQSDDQAAAQVASAKQQLASAQAALAALDSGATPQQIQMDEASVQTAQVAVNTAQRQLGEAVLTAPVAGTVTLVNLTSGQAVSGGGGGGTSAASSASSASTSTAEIQLDDPTAYEVTGTVSDAQVGEVADGQSATITPAGASQGLLGKVTAIAPSATVSSGVATFGVTVTVEDQSSALRPGSSASVSIIVNQAVHVLSVPSSAVHSSGAGSTVQVLESGRPVAVPVQVGAADPFRTQIISGLTAGQSVVIAVITSQVPSSAGGGFGGFLGGGVRTRGGGGGGGGGGGFGGGG